MKKYIRKIDRLFSPVTGNNSGLMRSFAGRTSTLVKSLKSDVDLEEKEGSEIEKKGYANVKEKIPREVVEELRIILEESIKQGKCTYKSEFKGSSYSDQITSYEGDQGKKFDFGKVKEIKEIITDEVSEKIKSYYGSYFEPDFVKIYRNYHVPEDLVERVPSVFSDDWHCDGRRTDYVKLFVALNEVTSGDGPFHVVDKETTKRLYRSGFDRSDPDWQKRVWRQASPEKMTGPPGTAMIANTNTTLHRAGHPEEGHVRDIALIQFGPSSKPLPEDWPSEVEYERNGKPIL